MPGTCKEICTKVLDIQVDLMYGILDVGKGSIVGCFEGADGDGEEEA
jgi:hypothetical protein